MGAGWRAVGLSKAGFGCKPGGEGEKQKSETDAHTTTKLLGMQDFKGRFHSIHVCFSDNLKA